METYISRVFSLKDSAAIRANSRRKYFGVYFTIPCQFSKCRGLLQWQKPSDLLLFTWGSFREEIGSFFSISHSCFLCNIYSLFSASSYLNNCDSHVAAVRLSPSSCKSVFERILDKIDLSTANICCAVLAFDGWIACQHQKQISGVNLQGRRRTRALPLCPLKRETRGVEAPFDNITVS